MYDTLELVIMGLIVALNVIGAIAILATIDKPRQYVRLGEGLRAAVAQVLVMGFLFWFGYLGRTMEQVGELMTIITWIVVFGKLFSFMAYLGTINSLAHATKRSTGAMVWTTISVTAQLTLVSLMFGLALAYGG